MRVAWRAVLMLSRLATVEEVRGEPFRLIRRRRSLWVSDFAWGGEEARDFFFYFILFILRGSLRLKA